MWLLQASWCITFLFYFRTSTYCLTGIPRFLPVDTTNCMSLLNYVGFFLTDIHNISVVLEIKMKIIYSIKQKIFLFYLHRYIIYIYIEINKSTFVWSLSSWLPWVPYLDLTWFVKNACLRNLFNSFIPYIFITNIDTRLIWLFVLL